MYLPIVDSDKESVYHQLKDSLSYLCPLLKELDWFKLREDFLNSKIAIVCGSGLSGILNVLDEVYLEVPYASIPHFPSSKVCGHSNKLVFGASVSKSDGRKVPVVIMSGRIHCYEGFHPRQTVYPIMLLRLLGVSIVLLSNASGAVHPDFKKGDIMIIRDHIYLAAMCGNNPVLGPLLDPNIFSILTKEFALPNCLTFNGDLIDRFDRFLALDEAYNRDLSRQFYQASLDYFPSNQIHAGVYCYNFGPCYETPAEIDCIRKMGGDVVGMSTLPEVIMANQLCMKVMGFSLITNTCTKSKESHNDWLLSSKTSLDGLISTSPNHLEILDESKKQSEKIVASIKNFLSNFGP